MFATLSSFHMYVFWPYCQESFFFCLYFWFLQVLPFFFFIIIIIILEKIATSTNRISEKLSEHMHSLSRIPHSMHLFFNSNLFVFFCFFFFFVFFISCPSQFSFYYPYPPQKDKKTSKVLIPSTLKSLQLKQ